MSAVLDCVGEVPWDSIDPGIVGVVRALVALGFVTRDSGDGKHKATLGHEEGSYSTIPHVVLHTRDMQRDMERLFLWCEEQGFEDIEIQGGVLRNPTTEPPNQLDWFIIVGGEELYGWTP